MFLLYSWGSRFGVPSIVPMCLGLTPQALGFSVDPVEPVFSLVAFSADIGLLRSVKSRQESPCGLEVIRALV